MDRLATIGLLFFLLQGIFPGTPYMHYLSITNDGPNKSFAYADSRLKYDGFLEVAPRIVPYENMYNATDLFNAVENHDDFFLSRQLQKGIKADLRIKKNGKTLLYVAAKKGFNSTVKILLDNGADVNALVKYGHSKMDLLSYATCKGDKHAVLGLLGAGAFVNSRSTCYQFTPLHHAVINKQTKIAKILIEHGADVNAVSANPFEPDMETDNDNCIKNNAMAETVEPLAIAAYTCEDSAVNLLIQNGADIDGVGTEKPPLFGAILGHCEKVATSILDYGASFLIQYKGLSPLQWSMHYSMDRLTKNIIGRGFVNFRNDKGRTALHTVKDAHIAQMLLDAGADVNAVDSEGLTPLHNAAASGMAELVKVLVENNADLGATCNTSWFDSLDLISTYKKFLVITKKREPGFERSLEGLTPVSAAVTSNNQETLSVMINSGKSVLNQENSEWPPLHVATLSGYDNIVQYLILNGADVNIRDIYGLTALHKAIMLGKTKIVTTLLSLAADVNVTDVNGWTPLHVAVMHQHIGIAEMLIVAGCNIDVEDNLGFSSLVWAQIGYRPYFYKLFVEKDLRLNPSIRYDYFDTFIQSMKRKNLEKIATLMSVSEIKEFSDSFDSILFDVNYDIDYFYDIIYRPVNFYSQFSKLDYEKISHLEDYKRIITDRMLQIKNKHLEMLTMILANINDVESQDRILGWGAIHWAAAHGDMEGIKLMVDNGVYINLRSKTGQTPMFLANYLGQKDIYNYLKSEGGIS